MDTQKNPKYYCPTCDFITANKKDFKRHSMTAKHKKGRNGIFDDTKKNPKAFQCECGLSYKYKSGLYRHKLLCKISPYDNDSKITTFDNDKILDALIRQQELHKEETSEFKKILLTQQQEHQKQLQEQQQEHQKQIQELIPQLHQITNITNNNTTTNNNKFNLNFFLNEQCKDAMSIQNFIQNLDIGVKELEHMGNVGYVNGMMSIFSNTLGAMDVYKRPLHCTDLKRETLYIKQGDTWHKDTDDKSELIKLIKSVERKNYGTLRQWEKQHPDAFECDTPDNIEYMKISTESLGGEHSTEALKLNKIMKHVIREVYVK